MRYDIFIFIIGIWKTVEAGILKKRQATNPCDSCHRSLSDCSQFPFKNERDQAGLIVWSQCMEQAFQSWRQNTGTDFWPVAETLIYGPVGQAQIDRQQCFDEIVNNRDCITCGVHHPIAAVELHAASTQCWEYVSQQSETPGSAEGPVSGFSSPGEQQGLPQSGYAQHLHPSQLLPPGLFRPGQPPHPGFYHSGQQQQPGQYPQAGLLHSSQQLQPGQFAPGQQPLVHQGHFSHPNDPRRQGLYPGQVPAFPNYPREGQQGQQILLVPIYSDAQGHRQQVPFFTQGRQQEQHQQTGFSNQRQLGQPQPGISGLLGAIPDLPVPASRPATGNQNVPRAPSPSGALLGPIPHLPAPQSRSGPSLVQPVTLNGLFAPTPDLPLPPTRSVTKTIQSEPEPKIPVSAHETKTNETGYEEVRESASVNKAITKLATEALTTTTATTSPVATTDLTTTSLNSTNKYTETASEATTTMSTSSSTTEASTTSKRSSKRRSGRRGGRKQSRRQQLTTTTAKPVASVTTAASAGIEKFWSAE